MLKVLILHGWGGSDYPHWQAWLSGEIAKDYGTVSFPLLDNPHFPSKNRWMRQVKELLSQLNPDVVICHSLANTLWFHLCNDGEISKVKRLLLVAPPRINLEIDTIKTFFPVVPPSDLYAQEVLMIASDDDPYLSAEEAFSLQKALGVEMRMLEGAGHINADSGYGEWSWVKEWVCFPSSSGSRKHRFASGTLVLTRGKEKLDSRLRGNDEDGVIQDKSL